MAEIQRNEWPEWSVIAGRNQPEYALEDLLGVEETDEGFPGAFLGYVEDPFSHLPLLWIYEPDHHSKRLQGGEAEIAGLGKVVTPALELIKKSDDQVHREVFNPKGSDFDTIIVCCKGEEKLKSIPVGLDGLAAHSSYIRKVVIKELMDWGGEFHIFQSCQMVKS